MERVRQPWRLPGQYLDEETGLHYSVERYYSPAHGRFLSMDPQRLPGGSLNYYTYCDGDPVNRVDPTGEISLTLGTVLIGIGFGIAVGAAIGAGVELYKQRNQEETDWGQVGRAALIGGCLGGISGAVFVVGSAALVGALGVVGAGAAAGAIAGAVEYCVTAIGEGEWSWSKFGISVAAGAAAGVRYFRSCPPWSYAPPRRALERGLPGREKGLAPLCAPLGIRRLSGASSRRDHNRPQEYRWHAPKPATAA